MSALRNHPSVPGARLLAVGITLLALSSVVAADCYFPDGRTVETSYLPCYANSEFSSCCFHQDYCLSGGYCLSVLNGYHYRGGCTDQTFKSESCPKSCLANINSKNSSWVNIIGCSAQQNGGSWCCAYQGSCCAEETFTPEWGSMFAVSTAAPSSSTSGASSATTSFPYTTTSAANVASNQPTTSPPPNDSSPQASNNTNVIIVGATLGALLGLVCAVAGFLLLRRKKKQSPEVADLKHEVSPNMTSNWSTVAGSPMRSDIYVSPTELQSEPDYRSMASELENRGIQASELEPASARTADHDAFKYRLQ